MMFVVSVAGCSGREKGLNMKYHLPSNIKNIYPTVLKGDSPFMGKYKRT